MLNNESEKPKEDTSIVFRKCWALGESYYYLKTYHKKICLDNESPFYYKSRLESIEKICKSLEIEDDRINKFLEKLRKKIHY